MNYKTIEEKALSCIPNGGKLIGIIDSEEKNKVKIIYLYKNKIITTVISNKVRVNET